MKCDSVDIILTLPGWWTCFLPTAGVSALLRDGLCLTTALCACGTLRWREQRPGLGGLQGFPHLTAPVRALDGQTFVPSGTVPASPGLGASLLPKFWAEAMALLLSWWAGGAVSSSLERISHQRDRDRSGGQDGGRALCK